MNKKILIAATVLVAAAAAAGYGVHEKFFQKASDEIVLYGNVDIRQVSLAFEEGGRISELRAEEGDQVKKGQVLAVLDTRTLELEAEQASAQVRAGEQALLRLRNGSRPQEIAQARAQYRAAQAEAERASLDLKRAEALWNTPQGHAVSRQSYDQAVSAERVARQNELQAKEALQLKVIGSRVEDIRESEASLEASKANLAVLRHRIELGTLRAPQNAVVRSRLLEKGDMASASSPVFTLALTDPKWVRAYLSEKDLGRVKPGDPAEITTDSNPGEKVPGRVGFISSVAEFTPKNVQTEELRTSLVYEVRILFDDPDSKLRLGQPATVRLPPATGAASGATAGGV